jgi:hypothetical protein
MNPNGGLKGGAAEFKGGPISPPAVSLFGGSEKL